MLCFSLGSRLRGNDGRVRGNDGGVRGIGDAFNAPPPGASPAVASLPRPLRFAKGTVSSEPRITRIFADGLGCAAPFFPVFWVPAPVSGYGAGPAGMTGECAGTTGSAREGGLIGVLCFSLGSRLRGNDGGGEGMTVGVRERGDLRFHPHPRFKPGAGSSPLPSRERGFVGV